MSNHHEKHLVSEPINSDKEPISGTPENIHRLIESLLDRLEFHTTPALDEASQAIIAGLIDETTDKSLLSRGWVEYAEIVERIVESAEASAEKPDRYTKAQIGAIIHKSLIFSAAGNTLRYLEELDQAEVYAYNEGIDDVSVALRSEITEKINALEMSSEVLVIKLKGVVSEGNREYLRDLIEQGDEFEDMIAHAYGMILEEGGDPDEVLAEIGVIER
jgi:hypothetical protein